MSDSDARMSGRQARAVKLSTVVAAVLMLVLIVGVGELFVLRAVTLSYVKKLACYTVQYSPDSDPTAKDIRHHFHCPPAKALPKPPARPSAHATRPGGEPSTAATIGPVGRQAAPSPATSLSGSAGRTARPDGSPTAVVAPSAVPSRSPRSSVTPRPSPSGLLGGLLCDPRLLPICLR